MIYYLAIGLLVFLPSAQGIFGIGRSQSVAVDGQLICNGMPASNVRVKLYDDNIVLDSKLGEVRTDSRGYFNVTGSISEISTMDPKIDIFHKCNYGGLCYKKLVIKIPHSYISSSKQPSKTFNSGTIELANKFSGTTTDCLNKRK